MFTNRPWFRNGYSSTQRRQRTVSRLRGQFARRRPFLLEPLENRLLLAGNPVVSIGDASVTEGGNLQFGVSLSNPVVVDTVIAYSTADGTATTADSDYTPQTGQTITIPAGQTSGTITVATTDDNNVELDETLLVELAGAQTTGLMLDFGGSLTATAPGGPAHAAFNGAGVLNGTTDIRWNTVATSDISAGLIHSDGSAATGVSVDIGIETGDGSKVVDWSGTSFAALTGTRLDVFQNDNFVKDYTRTAVTARAMGVRLSGLAAGVYDVYAVADDTFWQAGTGNNTSFDIYAGVTAGSANFDFSPLVPDTLENTAATGWVAGNSYSVQRVTVAAGQDLVVISDRGLPFPGRGQFNLLQIVSSASPTATGTIINDDHAPVAVDDQYTTDEDSVLAVSTLDAVGTLLANDFDLDEDALTVVAHTQGATGGLVSVQPDGSFTYDPNGQFDWLPAGATAVDTFEYTISDSRNGTDTATVTVTVTGVNDPPVADAGGPYVIDEGASLTLDATASSDADDAFAGLTFRWDVDGDGDFDENVAGDMPSLTWADLVALGINDGPDVRTVTLEASDGTNTATDSTTLTVNNAAPVANADSVSTKPDGTPIREDEPITFTRASLLANDSDVPADLLTITSFAQPNNGTLIDNGDGSFTYTPIHDFNGADHFTYTISDGDGGTASAMVTISVEAVNDAPIANDDSLETDEDVAVTADLRVNDSPGPADENIQTLTISHLNGTAVVSGDTVATAHGSVMLHADGTVTYTPGPDYNGPDNFTYTVLDSGVPPEQGSASGIVTINPVNDPPTANAGGPYAIDEGSALTLSGSGTDIDGDTLTFGWDVNNDGTFDDATGANATLTWAQLQALNIPDGPASRNVRLQVSDGTISVTSAATTLTVNNVAPSNVVVSASPATINEGQTTMLSGSFTDPGNADTHTVTIVWGDGTASTMLNLAAGVTTFSTSHQFRDDIPSGTSSDVNTVKVFVTDDDGGNAVGGPSDLVSLWQAEGTASDSADGNQGTLSGIVSPATGYAAGKVGQAFNFDGVNDFSTIPDSATLDLTRYTFDAWINWQGGGNIVHGILSKGPFPENYALLINRDDRNLIHALDIGGSRIDLITPPNSIPLNTWIHVAATFDGSVARTYINGVQAASRNASGSPTTNNFALRIGHREGPALFFRGLIDEVGLYSRALNTSEIQTLYNAGNAGNARPAPGTPSATTTVTVNNVAPVVAITAPASTPEGTTVVLNRTITDPGTDTFTQVWSVTKNGVAYASGTGANFSFTPNDNGTYVVSITVTDDDGGVGTDSKTIAVNNVAPSANGDGGVGFSTDEDTPLTTASVLLNDTDPAGPFDPLTVVSVDTSGTIGLVTNHGDGTFEYDPNGRFDSLAAGQTTTDSFRYTIDDGDGGRGTATVTVTITGVNDPPVADAGGHYVINEGDGVTLDASASFDPDANAQILPMLGPGGQYVPTVGVYDEQTVNTNAVDDEGTGTYSISLATFKADVLAAFNADLGGIINFDYVDTGDLGLSVDDVITYGVSQTNGLQIKSPSPIFAVGDFSGRTPISGPFHGGVTGVDYAFHFSAGDRIVEAGLTVISRIRTEFPASIFVTFDFDDGSSTTLTSVMQSGDGTDDTFFGIQAPAGKYVTRIFVDNVAFTGVDDVGFIAAPAFSPLTYRWDVDGDGDFDENITGEVVTLTPAEMAALGLAEGPDVRTVTVEASDGTDIGTAQTSLTINNVAPTNVQLNLSASTINEGGSTTLSGTFDDPGTADTHTVTINWGDGNTTTIETTIVPAGTTLTPLGGGNWLFSATHQYLDDNPTGTPSDQYTISVTVTDDDSGSGSGSAAVLVNNVAPVVGSVTGPPGVSVGTPATFSAPFTDAGTLDTHTCTVNWGDNTSSPGTVTESNGSGTCTATHTYLSGGSYTVTFTVTDDDTGSDSEALVISAARAAFILNPTLCGSLTATGNAETAFAGPITVASNCAANAISASGNAVVSAGRVDVVGGWRTTGNATINPTPTPIPGPVADPLASLAAATGGTLLGQVNCSGDSVLSIAPGVYSRIQASGNCVLTMQPGTYVVAGGGYQVSGNASVSGSGVTIYNAGSNFPDPGGNFASLQISGNGVVNLTPPAAGPLNGILIFQARDNTRAMSLTGNANGMNGTIYANAAQLSLSGNGVLQASLVVDSLRLSGNAAASLTDGSGSGDADAAIIAAGQLRTGVLWVSIQGDTSTLATEQLASIRDAMATINGTFGPYGVSLVEVESDASLFADIRIAVASTSACGSAADGILGCSTIFGDITFLDGWDWYSGADPAAVGAGEYDLQTIATHELGHVIGLEHSPDSGSAMYSSLTRGVARRSFTTQDLEQLTQTTDDHDHDNLTAALRATTGWTGRAARLDDFETWLTSAPITGLALSGELAGAAHAVRGSGGSDALLGGDGDELSVGAPGHDRLIGGYAIDGRVGDALHRAILDEWLAAANSSTRGADRHGTLPNGDRLSAECVDCYLSTARANDSGNALGQFADVMSGQTSSDIDLGVF